MNQGFNSRIEKALHIRRSQSLTRSLLPTLNGNTAELTRNNQRLINFSSNDYLGLANDSELIQAWHKGLDIYGCGSGASPLVTGFTPAHQNFERALCEWLAFERAILFSSGFSANQALLFTLLEKSDVVYQDKLNHASLMEAGMLSPAAMRRFRHNDTDHLASLLKDPMSETANKLVVTEGVFSMDGDKAPLQSISNLIGETAWLAVDDAHGIGVLGDEGKGSCDIHQVKPNILIVTFGKAFGLSGSAILCDSDVGDYLTQFARHHVYSTAIPPAQAYALSHALHMIQTQHWRREKLFNLKSILNDQLSGFEQVIETQTPINPIIIGGCDQALSAAQKLEQLGLGVTAIRAPTVPANMSRLRITLTASHTDNQVKQLTNGLQKILGE
ncbi:8-amino-7-oxononanoate synthase [Vibrio genomosp. F10 str. 9ZC157]|uniref:8-amino-7-ketopelargonate synthase n=1 Tax=Vibrio genomosp. F10 str. ZF-129 TaxID=1187848 RepID=A0A1E5BEC3_9VIBR|nr:8-amino-7-oxononanoate synthase [Vibrio genomosp. F10]OEE33883.1 8-amino-7-oxononanoate synthase [Vibrio genomosp. F10 str. ZF-129]OEE95534.1 8-amino-7-oxononanoate synthase [Vibrio genomosp. F10 str. 9ZC157]